MRMEQYANLFGSHMPMRLAIEREMMGRCGRLHSQDSSFLLLQNSTGKLGKIEINDFMDRGLIR